MIETKSQRKNIIQTFIHSLIHNMQILSLIISHQKIIEGSCFLFFKSHLPLLSLLIGAFSPLTFKVIIDSYVGFFCCHLIFFNCKIFALQNYVVFCHTSTRISHRYTHVPSLPKLPSISLHTPTFQIVTEALFKFPASHSKFPLPIYFTYGILNFHVTLAIHLTSPSSPPPMSLGLVSASVSPLLP